MIKEGLFWVSLGGFTPDRSMYINSMSGKSPGRSDNVVVENVSYEDAEALCKLRGLECTFTIGMFELWMCPSESV